MKRILGATGIGLALYLSGCSFIEDTAIGEKAGALLSKEEKRVVLYASEDRERTEKVMAKFRTAYPDYEIELRWMGGGDVLDNLEERKEAPQGDIWWGGTPAEMIAGKKRGLFRAAPSEVAQGVQEAYRDLDDHWLGVALYPQAFVTAKVTSADVLPWQWEDLTLSHYQNQLQMISPRSDRNYQIWLGAVMYRKGFFQRENGKRWLLGVDANTEEYFVSEPLLMQKISAYPGTVTWLALPDALRWREQEKYPLKIYLPQASQPIPFSGVALLNKAPHPQGGELFLRFLYSDEVQEMLMKEDYQISARAQIPQGIKPSWYDEWQLSPQDLDWEWIAGMERENLALWEREVCGLGIIPQKEEKSVSGLKNNP